MVIKKKKYIDNTNVENSMYYFRKVAVGWDGSILENRNDAVMFCEEA